MNKLKENTEFVYTLSSRKLMVEQATKSIKTLKNHVSPEKISVFYTPPYDEHDEEQLEKLGVNLIKKQNQTESFNINTGDEEGHYGEKTNLCNIESENVVFLDCDTLILEDIWKVIEGDFEFKARPGDAGVHEENWRKMFERFDEEYMDWMPNAGFLIFKNEIHKQIGEKWLNYTNKDLKYERKNMNHQEQYALALSVSEYNIQKMTEDEHVMEWADKPNATGTVYHYITPNPQTFWEHLITSADRNLPFKISFF
jgi:hypothetical protein